VALDHKWSKPVSLIGWMKELIEESRTKGFERSEPGGAGIPLGTLDLLLNSSIEHRHTIIGVVGCIVENWATHYVIKLWIELCRFLSESNYAVVVLVLSFFLGEPPPRPPGGRSKNLDLRIWPSHAVV
jgi:hypothetical protein